MMSMLTTMLTCRWSARRIQRYLDADPAAPLGPREVERPRAHLATCAKSAAAVNDYRGIRRVLAGWLTWPVPDPGALGRLRSTARSLAARDGS